MENKLLVDTSILINLQREDSQTIKIFNSTQEFWAISRVTISEFVYGSRNNKEKQTNQKFLEKLPIIELNEKISKCSYQIIDKYCLEVKLGLADALIAATAITYNLPLWTTNQKHFKQIKELKLFKPQMP